MNNRLFSRDPDCQIPYFFFLQIGTFAGLTANGVELEPALPFLSGSPLLREGFGDL